MGEMIVNNYILYAPEALILPLTVTTVAFIMRWTWLLCLGVFIIGSMLMFYRGAAIDTSTFPSHALICPCDGKILGMQEYDEYVQIAIFLNIHNIHVQYAPVDGVIVKQEYFKGQFHPAYMFEKSQYNERMETTFSTYIGNVKMVQIAGQVARRIITFVSLNSKVKRGDPYGLIKFGSRVDMWVPKRKIEEIVVKEGDRVRIGDTLMTFMPF